VAQHDVEEILTEVIGTGARRLDKVVAQLEEQLKQHARQLTLEVDQRYQQLLADEMSTLRAVAAGLADIVDEQRSRLLLAGAQVNAHHQQLDREFAELDAAALVDVRHSLTQWQDSLTDDVPLPKMTLARSVPEERGSR
jgi:hypothetical protein